MLALHALRPLTSARSLPPARPTPQSLAAVPFGSIVIVLLIWMFISFPLCLFGTVVGRNWAGAPDHPCRCGGRRVGTRQLGPCPTLLAAWRMQEQLA